MKVNKVHRSLKFVDFIYDLKYTNFRENKFFGKTISFIQSTPLKGNTPHDPTYNELKMDLPNLKVCSHITSSCAFALDAKNEFHGNM